MSEPRSEYQHRLRALRWRLRIRWSWWVARRFRYRGQYLVGRNVPDVAECHSTYVKGHTCAQHDGSHVHQWVRCVVTHKDGTHPQEAHRCTVCGARKCDMDCTERRHHVGPHHEAGGYRMVGS